MHTLVPVHINSKKLQGRKSEMFVTSLPFLFFVVAVLLKRRKSENEVIFEKNKKKK